MGLWSVSDGGLIYLKKLTKLTALSLYGAQITDADMVKLKPLTRLSFLCLHHTHVTDEGLAHLKGLSNLSQLDIVGHSVTLAAARELNRALPSLSICR